MKLEDYPAGYEAIINVISRGDKKTYSTYFSEWNDWTFYRQPTIDSKYKMKNGDENIVQWHKDVLGKFSSTFIIWGQTAVCLEFAGRILGDCPEWQRIPARSGQRFISTAGIG
jgi:hypothetical protein